MIADDTAVASRPHLGIRGRPPVAFAALVTGLVACATLLAGTQPAAADERDALEVYAEQLIATSLDEARRQAGVGDGVVELHRDAQLRGLARDASDLMASTQELGHDPRIPEALTGQRAGDNAGYWHHPSLSGTAAVRADVAELVDGWMRSEGHRRNALDRRFTEMGVGVRIDADGVLWATVVYRGDGQAATSSTRSAPVPSSIDQVCPTSSSEDTSPFVDVQGRHARAIACLADRDIVQGVSADRFDPSATVTRGQLALLVERTLDELDQPLPSPLRGAFTDLSSSNTAGTAAERLAAAGIALGQPDGRFAASTPVTRGQLAAQLHAAREWLAGDGIDSPRGFFVDVPADRRFARAIDAVADDGLIAGHEDGTFRPGDPLRRDHAAAVIARVLADG